MSDFDPVALHIDIWGGPSRARPLGAPIGRVLELAFRSAPRRWLLRQQQWLVALRETRQCRGQTTWLDVVLVLELVDQALEQGQLLRIALQRLGDPFLEALHALHIDR